MKKEKEDLYKIIDHIKELNLSVVEKRLIFQEVQNTDLIIEAKKQVEKYLKFNGYEINPPLTEEEYGTLVLGFLDNKQSEISDDDIWKEEIERFPCWEDYHEFLRIIGQKIMKFLPEKYSNYKPEFIFINDAGQEPDSLTFKLIRENKEERNPIPVIYLEDSYRSYKYLSFRKEGMDSILQNLANIAITVWEAKLEELK